MVAKQIIASLILLALIKIGYAAECSEDFYFYKFEYNADSVNYVSRSLEKGCIPGNTQQEFYRLDLEKNNEAIYSYGFDPQVIFTDVINGNNEITGSAEFVEQSTFVIPTPVVDFDKISLKDNQGKELVSLTSQELESLDKNQNSESFSLFGWVNNLVKSMFGSLFSR